MKNKLIPITTFLVFSINIFSQDINYYKQLVKTTSDTKKKIEALDSVISISLNTDPETYIDYSLKFISFTKKQDSFHLAAKKAMNLQYILTDYKNDPEKAISIIDDVLKYKNKINDSFYLGGLFLKRGGANFRMKYDEAVRDYEKAIDNFGQNDSIYVADAYLFKGQALSGMGQFVPAGEDFNTAYKYYEKLKDYEYMQFALQGLITMYSMNGFYEKAEKEREHLYDKLNDFGLKREFIIPYFNQSIDFKKQGNYERQYLYLKKADSILKLLEDTESDDFITIHSALAEHFCDYDISEAEKEFKLIDSKLDLQNRKLTTQLNYYSAKAKYYEEKNQFPLAIEYAEKKLSLSKKINHKEDIMASYSSLSDLEYKVSNFKNSVDYLTIHNRIRDSVFNQNSINSLTYFQTLYETEKKEKELIEKNTNIQLLEKDNQSFRKLSIIMGISLMLLFGIILLYRNQKNLKFKQLLQQKFSQDLLISQEEERIRITKELHDGLGQKLLVLKNLLKNSGNNDMNKFIDETINEVRSISRDLHPFQLQELGVTKAIENTITQIDHSTSLFISSEIDNIDHIFKKEQELNIFRIIQESLNNILKHSRAKATKIYIEQESKFVKIKIKDNGIGFDFKNRYRETKSLGLKTLLERTKFLKGQMKVTSTKGEGTTIEYIIPI